MTRHRLAAVVVLVVVLVVAVAAVYVSGRDGGKSAGPLRLPTSATGDSIITTRVGRAVILGTIVASNPASRPAELDQVSVQDATDGMRFEGAYIARFGPDITNGAWGVAYWPPPGEHVHRLSAITIPPNSPDPDHGSVQIVLKLALTKPGTATFGAVVIDYHIGSHHYRAVVPQSFRICYPLARYSGHCSPPLPSGASTT